MVAIVLLLFWVCAGNRVAAGWAAGQWWPRWWPSGEDGPAGIGWWRVLAGGPVRRWRRGGPLQPGLVRSVTFRARNARGDDRRNIVNVAERAGLLAVAENRH